MNVWVIFPFPSAIPTGTSTAVSFAAAAAAAASAAIHSGLCHRRRDRRYESDDR